MGDALPEIQMDVFKFQVGITPHTSQFILEKLVTNTAVPNLSYNCRYQPKEEIVIEQAAEQEISEKNSSDLSTNSNSFFSGLNGLISNVSSMFNWDGKKQFN